MVEHLPYCGLPPHPGQLLQRFNFDPALIAALSLLTWLHCACARTWRERLYALGGWLVTAAALLSPLCALSVSLLSAHVAQQLILLWIAAPLIALGWSWPMPRPAEYASHRSGSASGAAFSGAGAIWAASAVFFIALWLWHMPSPYEA